MVVPDPLRRFSCRRYWLQCSSFLSVCRERQLIAHHVQYTTSTALLPWWSILLFTAISFFLAIALGFITATTGFNISVKYAIQILASFVHPGQPIAVMYVNLYGNSTTFQTLYMLQGVLTSVFSALDTTDIYPSL